MKKSNIITKIAFAIIALVFTITISHVVPEDQFQPYKLELDSLWEKEKTQQEYFVNITGNPKIAIIRHNDINIAGHSIELQQGKRLNQIFIFEHGDKFIGKYLKFADINGDSIKDLLFVSAQNKVAYLNILPYDTERKIFSSDERVAIDSIKIFNGEIDAVNNFIVTNGSDIYIDLQAGYAVQPRKIYKYNFKNKNLIKTGLSSLVTPKAHIFNYQNHDYLLATFVRATANTISSVDAEMLRSSTDKDTLAVYERYKHLEYEYGDFSSYILLYDDSLRFAFEPIEFFAWTNFTKATLVPIKDVPHIAAFTNAMMDEPDHQKCKLVTVCNLQGEIIKQIPLPRDYTDIFSENGNVVFYGEKILFITDENLNPINEIKKIAHAQGFVDINKDSKPEFLAFTDDILTVYSADFEVNAMFKIEQEFVPYPEEHSFATLQINGKDCFLYNTRLFYYLFSYKKNNIAIFKFPFYIAVFLFIYGILYLILRLNSKRLEKENLRLEQIVTERTKEIAMQKEEIETQANELESQNTNLRELSKFKELMTGTIIHDLKNPLNNIIANTKDKKIRQSGYNMLNIVLNVLDINKAKSTKLSVNFVNENVERLIENAVLQVEYIAEQKNLSFEKIINKEFKINADKDLTIRILVNLLTNAVKFSPVNKKITIRATEQNGFVQIDVIDYGKGIPEENIKHLFKEYSQLEARNSGSLPSTGLGLYFCKIAAEAQNAKIFVKSIVNRETCFSIAFPIVSVKSKTQKTKEKQTETVFLTEEEMKEIQPVIDQLKQTEIYKGSDILKILMKIDSKSENVTRWKEKIKSAAFASNNELYQKLLNNGI